MKVLVALDFGEPSLEALRQARELAHGVGGTLAACHVLPIEPDTLDLVASSNAASAELTAEEEAARRALLVHAREKLGLELPELFVGRGPAYASIVRRAEILGADYVAVGTHGRRGLARVVLGSVAERVVRHAHCSVLVARPGTHRGPVLVATDLSPASLPAIREGAAASRRAGVGLVVASVLDWGEPAWGSAGLIAALPAMPTPELLKQASDSLRGLLDRAIVEAGAMGESRVVEGSAATEIVHLADELDARLLVVGTQGRTGLARLALGSVAERVIRHASCSVLAARRPS
jgi:nucleotide-binding universal stress UspA family protein